MEREKELSRIKTKVDRDLELGAVAWENMDLHGLVLLFENIKGYKKGYKNTIEKKLLTCSLSSSSRIALMLGLPKETPSKDLIQIWGERVKNPAKPVIVETGPCKQNMLKGTDVDYVENNSVPITQRVGEVQG
ncbi:MAG: hypothetical protein WCO26_12805 [Deltaproteobacteria bacterium]